MKKLIMLGTAQSAYEVPYDDDSYEIWGLGACYSYAHDDIKRIDLGFELHDRALIEDEQIRENDSCDFKKFNNPFYVQDHKDPWWHKRMVDVRRFPIEELLRFVNQRKYFTCSWAYLIPYAVMLGYEHIELHKISLANDQEYVYERPCIEFWCELMIQKYNVKIVVPDDSYIFHENVMYAYENKTTAYKAMARNKFLWKRHEQIFEHYTKILIDYGKNMGTNLMLRLAMGETPKNVYEDMSKTVGENLQKQSQDIQVTREELKKFQGCLQAEIFYNELIK